MSEPLQLLILRDGVTVIGDGRQGGGGETEPTSMAEKSLGKQLAEYTAARGKENIDVQLFVSEDLLFYKTLSLPPDTRDLKEAIGYQLGMLVPFAEEDLLYGFVSRREKSEIKISLVASSKKFIEPYLEELAKDDMHIVGLYPAYLRYVTKAVPKDNWALVLQGRATRILLFAGNSLAERLLPASPLNGEELRKLCDTEKIYCQDPPSEGGFRNAGELLTAKPLLREFNLLPASYRRPEFSRFFLMALVALNICALLAMVGGKEYQLRNYSARIDKELATVAPLVREVRDLRAREKKLSGYIDEVRAVGQNSDLIAFMEKLTTELPDSAYLDQLRMDGKQKSVTIQGYTTDIGALTAKLQEMGEAKLKSTSRRRNQTYFNVEINLP